MFDPDGERVIERVRSVWRGALVLAAVCGPTGCKEANQFVAPPPPKVTVAVPLKQEIVTFRALPGRTKAVESVEVRARVGGYLKSVEFEEGRQVEKGALLYTIDPAEFEAAVKAAEAEKAATDAKLKQAEAEFKRVDRLYKNETATEKEFIDATAEFELTKANKMAAEAALTKAQLDLGYTKITAPISGRVNQTEINPGNLVGKGEATVLTTIVPWDPIHVFVTVDERMVLEFNRRVAAGNRKLSDVQAYLRLTDGAEYPYVGQVDYIDNQVNRETGTAGVRVLFKNPDRFLAPGSFVRVRFPSPPREAVLVPEDAAQRDLAGYYLYVIDASGEVSRIDVEVGEKYGQYKEITSGLKGDETVVIKGLQRIRPGVKVESETVELPKVEFKPATSAPSSQPASTESKGS